MTELVKVFGCRPSQVWRQGTGPAYENRPCTNPRGCGDGLWGFRVWLGWDDYESGSAPALVGSWRVRFYARRAVDRYLAAADIQHVCADLGKGRAWGHSS